MRWRQARAGIWGAVTAMLILPGTTLARPAALTIRGGATPQRLETCGRERSVVAVPDAAQPIAIVRTSAPHEMLIVDRCENSAWRFVSSKRLGRSLRSRLGVAQVTGDYRLRLHAGRRGAIAVVYLRVGVGEIVDLPVSSRS